MNTRISTLLFRTVILAAAFAAPCFMACMKAAPTSANDPGGSSSEVVAFTGAAQYPDGSVAANAVVRLRPNDYLTALPGGLAKRSAIAADVHTDASGIFRIDSIDTGAYSIEISDNQANGAVALVFADKDSEVVHVAAMTLNRVGEVSGSVVVPSGSIGATYIMVYGLERQVAADSLGRFTFTDLPEGEFTFRVASLSSGVGACDSARISVLPAASRDIGTIALHTFSDEEYTGWATVKTIAINTAASGAGIDTTITDFPLLVRLDGANFDFGASLSYIPGADIRFADESGNHLAYEIERWDAALQKAEIWVKVDTIHGNDTAQFIRMFSGRAGAATWSNGAAVFDTAAGFTAVWHLGTSLTDVTYNSNRGTEFNTGLTEAATGLCRSFNGSSSYVKIDSSYSLDMVGKSLSIIVWQQWAGGPYAGERIFFEHNIWPDTGDYGFSARPSSMLSFDFPAADSEARSAIEPIDDGSWHLAAVSFDNPADSAALYFDGRRSETAPVRAAPGSSSGNSFIGSRGGFERFFRGNLDEIWVMARWQSAAFMKLAYENQRFDQKMITIR